MSRGRIPVHENALWLGEGEDIDLDWTLDNQRRLSSGVVLVRLLGLLSPIRKEETGQETIVPCPSAVLQFAQSRNPASFVAL